MRPVNLYLDINTVRLLRIPFSFLLMPVYLVALSLASAPDPFRAIVVFVILHLLVYPASNGFNSFHDKDTGSIGGLRRPPVPGPSLYYTTLALDLIALAAAALLVSWAFFFCLLLYITASRSYSARPVRLKRRPFGGFLLVVFFQGAFTLYMVATGISTGPVLWTEADLFILTACSLQIAGAYPLTQVFQHDEDRTRGDNTLSLALGVRGTFIFSTLMFLLSNLCYTFYFSLYEEWEKLLILQLCFFVPAVYLISWLRQAFREEGSADYDHAMRMSLIAATCMNICFFTHFAFYR